MKDIFTLDDMKQEILTEDKKSMIDFCRKFDVNIELVYEAHEGVQGPKYVWELGKQDMDKLSLACSMTERLKRDITKIPLDVPKFFVPDGLSLVDFDVVRANLKKHTDKTLYFPILREEVEYDVRRSMEDREEFDEEEYRYQREAYLTGVVKEIQSCNDFYEYCLRVLTVYPYDETDEDSMNHFMQCASDIAYTAAKLNGMSIKEFFEVTM